jgi:hypothetical protein
MLPINILCILKLSIAQVNSGSGSPISSKTALNVPKLKIWKPAFDMSQKVIEQKPIEELTKLWILQGWGTAAINHICPLAVPIWR